VNRVNAADFAEFSRSSTFRFATHQERLCDS
jgi:hypothetical protein